MGKTYFRLSNGNFFQDGEYKCTVVLNGVSLTSQRGAAIDIQNGKRIDIEVVDGTTNTFVDCAGGEQDCRCACCPDCSDAR